MIPTFGPVLQDRLDAHLAGTTIHDPTAPGHADARADAENLIAVQRLQRSPAYWDPQHVDHALVKAKVSAFYASEFDGAEHGRRPNAMVIDTSDPSLPMRPQLSRGAE